MRRAPYLGDLVGDLFAQVVVATKLLAHDVHNVFSVAVVFCEDERLGHFFTAREHVREHAVFEGHDEGADLVLGDHVAVQVIGLIGHIFIRSLPAHFPRATVPDAHDGLMVGGDARAASRNLRPWWRVREDQGVVRDKPHL